MFAKFTCSLPILASCLCTVLAERPRSQAPAVVTQEGKHFVVHFHGGDEPLARRALDVAEATWPLGAAILGEADPKPLLALHLYRTIAEYEAAELALTGGRFQRNLAMTSWKTREAHVALQPPCRDEVLRVVGLPSLTVAMLAWEASHLIRLFRCENFADHPAWFADGFAAHIASRVVEQMHACGGAESAPFFAKDLVLVQRLMENKKMPPVVDIISDRIDELDMRDRYALRAVFFAFVAENATRLGKVADVIRRTGGGSGFQKKVSDTVSKLVGRGADKDFERYVRALSPKWDEVYRSLSVSGTEWQQLAFGDTNAIAWNTRPMKAGVAAHGSLRILPGDARQLNFLFGRTDAGFYSIAFVADEGFTVFDYQPQREEPWQQLGRANAPGLRLGYGSTFAIEAKGERLAVQLDSLSWQYELPRRLPDEVFWGLGAQAGSAGLWINLEVGEAK